MCTTIFDEGAADKLIARLKKMTPTIIPKWGSMTAITVVPHMADVLREGLGEKIVPFKPSVYSWPILRYILSQWAPWYKGAPAPKELLQGTGGANPTDFENDMQILIDLIRRFSESRNKTVAINSTFGKMDTDGWGRYVWRDINHHLKQFGL